MFIIKTKSTLFLRYFVNTLKSREKSLLNVSFVTDIEDGQGVDS